MREVWEETGLCVEPRALRGVYGGPDFRVRYPNGDETTYVMSVFDCRRLGGTLRADGVETLDARWVAPAELDALPLGRWVRVLLPRLLASPEPWLPPVTWSPPTRTGQ